MEKSVNIIVWILSGVVVFVWWVVKSKLLKEKERVLVPPGSMGLPYLGETLKLYKQNPNTFFSSRQNKYGDIFKTHILGCPCVMISSPHAAKLVLLTKAHLFKPTYPPTKQTLIGPQALFFHHGHYHSTLKNLILSNFLPSSLRSSFFLIDNIVLNFLPSWHNNTINTLHEMKKYAFDVAMISVFGCKGEVQVEQIKNLYQCLEKGYNSMPLNFPGTPYHKALKARKVLNEMLGKLIAKRRASKKVEGGLLGILLKFKENKRGNDYELSDSQIADNVIGVIFAAHDTTASVLTWVLKYLHDNQHLLDAVLKEQEGIRQRRIEGNRGLTWEDTRKMPLTTRVIQETLRRASILSFTFREAVHDVEFEGYVIPKGWKVLPLFRSIHHCADFFPHPEKFDPSRFEMPPRPNTFMPFGYGVHSCPGSELAKLEMLIFLHHLITTYRWKATGNEDGIQYGPFPVPKHGYPIMVYPRK